MVMAGGKKYFALRQGKKCTAKFVFAMRHKKTHSKVCVCLVPRKKRIANSIFAERFFSSCVLKQSHGKAPLCRAAKKIRMENLEFLVVHQNQEKQKAFARHFDR
jgi:hypothetical protein